MLKGYLLPLVWFCLLPLALCFLNCRPRSLIGSFVSWRHLIWRDESWTWDGVANSHLPRLRGGLSLGVLSTQLSTIVYILFSFPYILFPFSYLTFITSNNNALSKHEVRVVLCFPFWFLVCIHVRTYSCRFLFVCISMWHLVVIRFAYKTLSCGGVDWFKMPTNAVFARHDGLHELE